MTPKTQSEVQTLISRVDRLGWISLEARNLGYGSSLLEEEEEDWVDSPSFFLLEGDMIIRFHFDSAGIIYEGIP